MVCDEPERPEVLRLLGCSSDCEPNRGRVQQLLNLSSFDHPEQCAFPHEIRRDEFSRESN